MRRQFKPYNKRKPFKRKSGGGGKYMLRGGSKLSASSSFSETSSDFLAKTMSGFFGLLAKIHQDQRQIRTTNK